MQEKIPSQDHSDTVRDAKKAPLSHHPSETNIKDRSITGMAALNSLSMHWFLIISHATKIETMSSAFEIDSARQSRC